MGVEVKVCSTLSWWHCLPSRQTAIARRSCSVCVCGRVGWLPMFVCGRESVYSNRCVCEDVGN